MSSLQGKVAIVTGASTGIGRGIALKLAAEGAHVVVNCRTAATGEALAKHIRSSGGSAQCVTGDVLSVEQMRALADRTVESCGKIDILVASAGGLAAASEARVSSADKNTSVESRYFLHIDTEEAARKLSVSTLAKINPATAVARHMAAANSGSILFVTSEGGRFPTPGQTVTSLAAGGLIMMSKVVAKELSRYRVRVNTIAVTLVKDTPSWDVFSSGESNRQPIYSKIEARAPFGLATPADIAEVAAFLVSDGAGFITGATVSPTGGLTY